MSLQQQIERSSKDIFTDGYAMSIGELMSMYESAELDIHPEFQRFYRWDSAQKSRLIESILIGIPLPSIFVSQRDDGVWDVIDGLQRLSTIFELAGILRDENGNRLPPLRLEPTKYLPALEGKVWSGKDRDSLSAAQRLYVKRAKIDVKIIKKESTQSSKYDLFQRLNTGGSALTDQEVRNCLLISINARAFEWMQELCRTEAFQDCIALTDKAKEEQYDMELVLRFLVLAEADDDQVRGIGDIGEHLTEQLVERATAGELISRRQGSLFVDTFNTLSVALSDSSFRRYDPADEKFKGGFLISAFEAVSLGVASNIRSWKKVEDSQRANRLEKRVKALWRNKDFLGGIGSGVRAAQRIPVTINQGRLCIKP